MEIVQLQGFTVTIWRSGSFCCLHENSSKLKLYYTEDHMVIDALTASGKRSLRIKVFCSHGYSSWIELIGAADQLG